MRDFDAYLTETPQGWTIDIVDGIAERRDGPYSSIETVKAVYSNFEWTGRIGKRRGERGEQKATATD